MQPNVEALTDIGNFAEIIECPQNRCAWRCVHKKWLSILFDGLFDAFDQIVDAHTSICVAFDTYQIVCADAQPVHSLLDAVMRFLGRKCNQRPLAETTSRFNVGHSPIPGQYHPVPGGKSQNCVSSVRSLEILNAKSLTCSISSHPVRICRRHYQIQTNCKTFVSFRFPSMWIRAPLQMCICVE